MASGSFFIGDGYDETGIIDAVSGLHGRVEFRFRPMTLAERAEYFRQVSNKRGESANQIAADWLAVKILSWSITDERPTSAILLTLRPKLFNRIFGVIFGDEGHDGSTLEESQKN